MMPVVGFYCFLPLNVQKQALGVERLIWALAVPVPGVTSPIGSTYAQLCATLVLLLIQAPSAAMNNP